MAVHLLAILLLHYPMTCWVGASSAVPARNHGCYSRFLQQKDSIQH